MAGFTICFRASGGKRYELVYVRFPKGGDTYSGYKVLKETHLVVRG